MEFSNKDISQIADWKLDLNRIFEVFVELNKKWPRHGVSHPMGDYGWDRVAFRKEAIARADKARNDSVMKAAIEIVVQEKKLEILAKDDRELEKE